MNSTGGDATIGVVDCLQGELTYWDKRLNAASGKRMATARKDEAEMKSARTATTSIEESLRKMQRG